VALLGTAYVVTRVVAMQPYIGDLDATNFALALRDFDMVRYQPHFPGYPLYILLARIFHSLGAPAPAALELPALVVGLPATLAFYAACRNLIGRARARLAAMLWIVTPGLWLAVGQPRSDALGLALFVLAVAALSSWQRNPSDTGAIVVGVWLGLGLGVRLSYLPIAASALAVLGYTAWVGYPRGRAERAWAGSSRALTRAAFGTTIGVSLWLVPLAAVVGASDLARIATQFTAGHFSNWGGALGAAHAPALGPRLTMLGWSMVQHGLGAACALDIPGVVLAAVAIAVVGLAVACFVNGSAQRRALAFSAAMGLPYLLAIIVAQNPEKPRHVLPLLPLLIVLLAAGLPGLESTSRLWRRLATALAGLSMVAMAVQGAARAHTARHIPSPSFQLVSFVASSIEPEGMALYGGEEVRLFAYYAPWVRAKRAGSPADILADLNAGLRPPRILVSSKVPGLFELGDAQPGVAIARLGTFMRDPLVAPHYATIHLYELEPKLAMQVLSAH